MNVEVSPDRKNRIQELEQQVPLLSACLCGVYGLIPVLGPLEYEIEYMAWSRCRSYELTSLISEKSSTKRLTQQL